MAGHVHQVSALWAQVAQLIGVGQGLLRGWRHFIDVYVEMQQTRMGLERLLFDQLQTLFQQANGFIGCRTACRQTKLDVP